METGKEFTPWELMNMAQRLGEQIIKTYKKLNNTKGEEREGLLRSLCAMLPQFKDITTQAIRAGFNASEDEVFKSQSSKIAKIGKELKDIKRD